MFYKISLIAAFIAGMVALFAPCCISYLLPAYLGNIFKEKKQVILMTLVYSLGIFVVLLPVVLGAQILASWFFKLHDQTYLFRSILFIDKLNLLSKPWLKTKVTQINLDDKIYPIFTSNLIAFVIFMLAGLAMMVLTLQGRLGMTASQAILSQTINNLAFKITVVTGNPWLNLGFAAGALYLIYQLVRRGLK